MSIEANKAVVRRWLNRKTRMEVIEPGRYRVVDTPGIPDTDDFETIMKYDEQDNLGQYFEDVTVTVGDLIAEGDKVVVSVTATGTTTAPFRHLTTGVTIPAGKTITRRVVTILTVDDGKVVEERTHEDRLGILEQLGLVPTH
ncbi:ester cyclase [Microlunatus parietis]|uniref:Ketosteroid isomerase-like protein n=1 Tax=Microlunatus parietis TaxID=682979 RepID=A0A7Y9L9X7_9ACTN|nr:ester cyclase [Microlunatus parietis]NYE70067.1 ketosteroid isomerase-like protein [Microlunatus parietis]